ncbi:MAG: prephenate dehydrogenase [Ruminococcaceae bacterium]|nr:prephenate dehydrogenase [Oscillospiraceae bacterium]
MIFNDVKHVLIVGLGLLGGSYAKALKKKGIAVDAITLEQSSIDYALAHGIIDTGTTQINAEIVSRADLVVFALYPHIFVEWIRNHGHLLRPGQVVTDVTGVKESIVYEVQALLPEGVEYIAAHPMAGREVGGVENSDDSIFHGANYIVVPTEKNTTNAIWLCTELGYALGFADVSCLDPKKHDEMIGFLSQLTHCIAVSLMCTCDDPNMKRYTGDSFRDLTRIANINDEMWSELFLANQQTLLEQMEAYRCRFDRLYECIKEGDREGMREMMRLSTARRQLFDKKV